jgi:hypothetical protein
MCIDDNNNNNKFINDNINSIQNNHRSYNETVSDSSLSECSLNNQTPFSSYKSKSPEHTSSLSLLSPQVENQKFVEDKIEYSNQKYDSDAFKTKKTLNKFNINYSGSWGNGEKFIVYYLLHISIYYNIKFHLSK